MNGDDNRTDNPTDGAPGERLEDVLASIRALVTAEASSRIAADDNVLILTPDLRVIEEAEPAPAGEVLAEGVGTETEAEESSPLVTGEAPVEDAPMLDEEAIRAVVNRIVREELQGELGDRIGRNLRKLIRREIAQVLAERETGEG